MSRIGKRPVKLPEKVDFQLKGRDIRVKGPKGELSYTLTNQVNVTKSANNIVVSPIENASKESGALWGLTRTIIQNMVTGVTEGFNKSLDFTGVGYKAAVTGNKLTLNVGFSHPVEYDIPKGITIAVKGNRIEISGCDRELVGFVAAKIRDVRPPEPYKGKGIKYVEEVIIRKAGKTGGKQ